MGNYSKCSLQKGTDPEPHVVCALGGGRACNKKRHPPRLPSLRLAQPFFKKNMQPPLLARCFGAAVVVFVRLPQESWGRRQGAGSGWWVAERRKAFLPLGFLHSPSKLFTFSPFKVIFLKLGYVKCLLVGEDLKCHWQSGAFVLRLIWRCCPKCVFYWRVLLCEKKEGRCRNLSLQNDPLHSVLKNNSFEHCLLCSSSEKIADFGVVKVSQSLQEDVSKWLLASFPPGWGCSSIPQPGGSKQAVLLEGDRPSNFRLFTGWKCGVCHNG